MAASICQDWKFTDKKSTPDSEITTLLDSTICPICQEEYEEPKLLPCAHHLCRKCLITWLKSSTGIQACPFCRRIIPNDAKLMPEALADSLPTDVVLASLAESSRILSTAHVCSACEEGEIAVDFCFHCGDKLCRTCSVCHTRMNITKSHEIKPLADLTPVQLAIKKREKCGLHSNQYLELYCPKHTQPICLQCLSESHAECGSVKTVNDVAKHQRSVAKAQIDKLGQMNIALSYMSEDIQWRQQKLSQSQDDCRHNLSALISRLAAALFSREKELDADVDKVPETTKRRLQKKKEDVEESRFLVTAYMKQAVCFLQYASDVNITRLAAMHAARAARLAAQISQPLDNFPEEVMLLNISQDDVQRIEELLRKLGRVEVSALDTRSRVSVYHTKEREAIATKRFRELWASNGASFTNHNVHILNFNPFTSKRREEVLIQKARQFNAICLTFNQMLLLSSRISYCLYMTNTAIRPCTLKKIFKFPVRVRAMTFLDDGDVAITTDSTSIYFVDTYKEQVQIRRIETKIPYWGIASGLHGTVVLSNEGSQSQETPSIEVMTKDGQLLGTFADSNSFPGLKKPRCLCRVGDHVIVSDCQKKCLFKMSLDKHRNSNGILKHLMHKRPNNVCSDYAGNIYALHDGYVISAVTLDGHFIDLDTVCGKIDALCPYPDGSGYVYAENDDECIMSVTFCE